MWVRPLRVTQLSSATLLLGLVACASNRSEEASETSRVATDTVLTKRQVVDTSLVMTDTTIATDTMITADTTIAADTTFASDTTVAIDTTRLEDDRGVITVDTTSR